jgi:hypothetical protein
MKVLLAKAAYTSEKLTLEPGSKGENLTEK